MAEKSYQDLLALGESEEQRMAFLPKAVSAHKSCPAYGIAKDAEEYYAKKNVTILKFQKFLMNTLGELVPDIWSSNYKLTHGFFRQFVMQQVQYVLSNGVFFTKDETKARLGLNFDNALQSLAKKAMVDGIAFGYWNYDHLEVFPYADTRKEAGFAPLFDEDSGALKAGIRYWTPSERSQRWTLYELDGLTEYIQRRGEKVEILKPKRPYVLRVTASAAGGDEEISGENYAGFPIIPIYANDLRESELIGIRPSIDCYDFIMSGMANTIDETAAFYWTLSGTGGMDDVDVVNFKARMQQLKAAVLPPDTEVEAHTITVPVEANKLLLDYLKADMFEQMMLLDVSKALSGDKTATAIRMAYQPQDDRSGDFEYCIRDFLGRLMALIGIEDEPTFKWNRIANMAEETQMVMSAAALLDQETALQHLPWLSPEEVQAILERSAADESARYLEEEALKNAQEE